MVKVERETDNGAFERWYLDERRNTQQNGGNNGGMVPSSDITISAPYEDDYSDDDVVTGAVV